MFLSLSHKFGFEDPNTDYGGKSPKSQSLNMRSQGRNGIQTWAQLQKTGSTKPESNPWWETLSFQLQKSWKNEAIITGFLIAFTMTMSK